MNQEYDSVNNRSTDGHDIVMQGRKIMEITGVKQVESFDSEEFLLVTVMGMLIIKGENLQMKNLDVDRGLVAIKGRISSFVYTDQSTGDKSKGLFSKLFK
ncbi:sporulation protein YabP [Bacillus badius]|uniref:Forespore shell protein n=1 Tax=Bacillus badius TaxID=1455 RepID=A0ABR5APN1_BACBA|nr:sporulation protein YabP [Bacillus badius]KIL72014.1 forespore shell protein [Bacillus badius]KIL75770.1 forespore shell protein [Bacillus badius]KZR56696.1 sporulation protein YabP [Bacillus badius]MED4714920.1 sporulation protein YabP [Bacillus badius]GLY12851.1 spore protein YabP [Bacillus badius]